MPRFIAKGTFASGSGAVSPGIPSGMQDGDFMLLFVHSANQAASAPTGWTAIPTVSGSPFRGTAGAAGGVRLDMFYRWWVSGDTAPSVADTGDITAAIICGYGSVDPTTPFDGATPIASNAAASTTLTLPGITTQTNRALVVQAAALDRDAASTSTVTGPHANTNLTNEAERHDQTVSTNSGGGLWVGDGIMPTAGATGDSTATQTSNAFACITVSLRHDPDDPFINSAGAAGATANKPEGTIEGDLMVAYITVSGAGATLTGPAGWTQERANDDGSVSAILAYKIAGASEGSSYTFTFSSGSSDSAAIATYAAGSFDEADPLDTSSYNSGNSGTRTATGITTTNANTIIGFWSAGANAPTSIPSGMYRRMLYDAGLYAYHDELVASAGATGDRSHTQASGPWGVMLYGINPAGAGTQNLAPSLFTNTNTFHAPTVTRGAVDLQPSLYSDGDTFHAPTVTSIYTLTAPLLTNTSAFYAPTITVGGVTLTPALFTNTSTFFAPTVTTGAVDLQPSLYVDDDTFYAPTLTSTYTLSPPLLSDGDTFHAPTVTAGGVTISPPLYSDGDTFHAPTVQATYILTPSLFTNTNTFHAPTVTSGAVTLEPPLLTNTSTFYGPTIEQGTVLSPPLLENTNTFHAPTVTGGAVTLQPPLLTNESAFYALTVAVGAIDLQPPLLTNTSAFYAPTITSVITLEPSLLANASAFYSPTIAQGALTLLAPLVVNENTLYAPVILGWFEVNDANPNSWALVNDANANSWAATTDTGGDGWSPVDDSSANSWSVPGDTGGTGWTPVDDT